MKIIIIGGRGNGTVVASTIEDCRKEGQNIECVGFLNDNENEIDGYPVLGNISKKTIEELSEEFYFTFAMSNIKQAFERYQMLKMLDIERERYATIIHPTAVVSDKASLGVGVVLMPLTLVGPDVTLGDHTQLYAQSFIGHDTSIGEMVFVANNASIGGRIVIEKGAHIGSNSSIVERVHIGEFAVVGLGSVVLKNIGAYEKAVGNPAKVIGKV